MTTTRVDFYLVSDPQPRVRLVTACRLIEKAFDQGLRVTVRTSSPAETAEFDDILWTFGDRSFVPHGVWPAEPAFAAATPVMVAHGALPESHRDVLVNLATDAPPEPAHYGRVCEVVGADEEAKRLGRVRWRTYRDAGLAPESHAL